MIFFYISITLTSHPAMRGLKVVCPDLKGGQKGSFSGRLSGLQARREPCGWDEWHREVVYIYTTSRCLKRKCSSHSSHPHGSPRACRSCKPDQFLKRDPLDRKLAEKTTGKNTLFYHPLEHEFVMSQPFISSTRLSLYQEFIYVP